MSKKESAAYDRRAFLRELAVVGVSASSIGCFTRAGNVGLPAVTRARTPLTVDEIGVQLYTVGDVLRQDFAGTLKQVAAIGYKQVEFAGYFNKPPREVRALLDGLGLKSASTHIGMDLLRSDLPAQIAIDARVVNEEVSGGIFGIGVLWIRHDPSLLRLARVMSCVPL